jgi:hypothetical protein
MKNSFEEVNRARCFNHTLQLSAKTLLKPFNVGMSSTSSAFEEDKFEDFDNDMLDPLANGIVTVSNDEGDDNEGGDEDGYNSGGEDLDSDDHADSDGFNELDEQEREKILVDTAIVRQTVTKVRSDSISVFRLLSLTINCRSGNYHLRSSIRQLLRFQPGGQSVLGLGSSHV